MNAKYLEKINQSRVNPFYHAGDHFILKMITSCTLIAHIDSSVINLIHFLKEIQYWGLLSLACFFWCWKMKLNVCRSRLSILLSAWRSFTEAASVAGFFSSSLRIFHLHVCWIKVRTKVLYSFFYSSLTTGTVFPFLHFLNNNQHQSPFWVCPHLRTCLKYIYNSCYNSCSYWGDWETKYAPDVIWGGGSVEALPVMDRWAVGGVAFPRAAWWPLPPHLLTRNPD